MIHADRGFVWSPRPSYKVNGSVLINGVEVKADVLDCSITRAVIGTTSKVGSCTIKINNYDGSWAGMFSKKDTIKIYADFGSGATQQFDGFVREINPDIDGFPHITIIGNDWAGEALMRVVNKQYNSQYLDDIFIDLVATYLPGHTTANVADMSSLGTFTINFSNKKLIDCFKDIMVKSGDNYCAYCDFDKDWHVFEKGSIFNLYEPIIHTRNMISIKTENTLSGMATKITLYGKDQEGMPMMVTVSDDPEGVGNIHEVYKDTNILTYNALVDRANAILAEKKTSEINCKEALVRGMIGLNPGDAVYMFAPIIGLQSEVFVPEFTHDIFGGKTMKTKVKWQMQYKMPKDISTLFKERIEGNQEILDISNPDDLENSYNFVFDDNNDVLTFTNTEVSNGMLQLTSGETTGTMLSESRSLSDIVTYLEIKYNGWNLGDSIFQVTTDGGLNWQTLTRNTKTAASYSGSSVQIKITLNSTDANPSPNVESMAVLYT